MKNSVLAVGLVALVFGVTAWAGSAHFVGVPQLRQEGQSILASGKVAGLGNIPQITVTVTGLAECVNRGSNKPSAGNKESFSATGDFPVQSGKANFIVELEASFQPSCNPPMTVAWSNLSITVTADDGTFLQYP